MRKIVTLIIISLFLGFGFANAQQASLYAGTPDSAGQNTVNVDRLDAMFNNPYGLAFDSWGNLWVSEFSNHTIRMITPDGRVYLRAGGFLQDCFKNATGSASRYSNPSGLCVGPGDTIYVADMGNHVIRKIFPYNGQVGTNQQSDVKAGKFSAPGAGNPNCLTRYPGYKDGKAADAQFLDPADVTCDKNGNLYVADKGNHCIRKIDLLGNVSTVAGIAGVSGSDDGNLSVATFSSPVGVHVEDNGDIYVAEWGNAQLRKISGGKVTTVLSFPPLWNPVDVVRDSRGVMYISDLARIIKYENSNWSIFAGAPNHNGPTGYANDTGTAARFNGCHQMVVDPKDYHVVYVADFYTHVIRKVTICDPYKPKVTLTGTTTFCTGDKLILTADSGFASYKWSTGETTRSITVTKTSNVSLKTVNDNLCVGYSDTFHVNVYVLNPSLIPTKTSFCPGDSTLLVSQSGFSYYTWYKNGIKFIEGADKQTIAVYDSGYYKVEVVSGPCKGTSSQVKISIGKLVPTLNYEGSVTLCEGDSLVIQPYANYNNYEWKNGTTVISTSKKIVVKTDGTYTLYVLNSAGCDGTSKSIVVTKRPKPAKPTITDMGGGIIKSSSATNNQWYRNDTLLPGATSQGYYLVIKGWYKVVVNNQYGCTAESEKYGYKTSEQEFTLKNKVKIYPNPNNGSFVLESISTEIGAGSIRISNMLGEIVFNRSIEVNSEYFNYDFTDLNLKKGIYFVNFRINDKSTVLKLVIE